MKFIEGLERGECRRALRRAEVVLHAVLRRRRGVEFVACQWLGSPSTPQV